MNVGYNIPFWHWTNAPFMQGKHALLMSETRRYIELVASTTNATVIQTALKNGLKMFE